MDNRITCLEHYVQEYSCSGECLQLIDELIDLTSPSFIITDVWRGQSNLQIYPTSWFSTSLSQVMASRFMNDETQCCLFHINLHPSVKYLIVNDVLKDNYFDDEEEVIIKANGTFYSDSNYQNIGFKEVSYGYYETWYK